MTASMPTVVFLHIPKTAGQTIHNELARVVGSGAVSPVRVHTQAPQGPQMPSGYRLYSGHLDWTELGDLPRDRFVFSVLRDPRERIASFYFYLLKEARTLSPEALIQPANTGKQRVLEWSADDYFFGGDGGWRRFISDHYDNFYCSYFATRKMRGHREISTLPEAELLARARAGIAALDRIYHTEALTALEQDVRVRLGSDVRVAGNFFNVGSLKPAQKRWPKLLERLESEASRARLEAFATRDAALMEGIAFARPAPQG